jgi:hypothetical protein
MNWFVANHIDVDRALVTPAAKIQTNELSSDFADQSFEQAPPV